ncbi:MAG TPA: hypothetical protein VF712_02220 [Thermoleophilaceae bacterium]|jgi:hypothetical protein
MRIRLAALAAATAIALGACGGDDEKKDEPAKTTDSTEQATTEAAADPAVRRQFQGAILLYNRGYDRFFKELKDNGGDLDELKADVSDYRDVIYEFDKDIRAIEFPDELVPQVNAILENNLLLIRQLDGIGNASSFNQAINQYDRFLKVREPTVKAVNNLMDQLRG